MFIWTDSLTLKSKDPLQISSKLAGPASKKLQPELYKHVVYCLHQKYSESHSDDAFIVWISFLRRGAGSIFKISIVMDEFETDILNGLSHVLPKIREFALELVLMDKSWCDRESCINATMEFFEWALQVPGSPELHASICKLLNHKKETSVIQSVVKVIVASITRNLATVTDYELVANNLRLFAKIRTSCPNILGIYKDSFAKCLLDIIIRNPFELARTTACELLLDLDIVFEEPRYPVLSLEVLASKLMNESETVPRLQGAMLWKVFANRCQVVSMTPYRLVHTTDPDITSHVLRLNFSCEKQLQDLEQDVVAATRGSPLHGVLEATVHLLDQLDDGFFETRQSKDMLDLMARIIALTHSFFESKPYLDWDETPSENGGNTTEDGQDHTVSVQEKITSCMWRSTKNCTAILLIMAKRWMKVFKGTARLQALLDLVGSQFIWILAHFRHWGIIKYAQTNFTELCTVMMGSLDEKVNVIPFLWLGVRVSRLF